MNRHNSTNQNKNICDIFAWFWCVVCTPCILIFKTIYCILKLISDIFARFWYVVRRLYIYFSTAAVKVHMLVAGETFQTHETFIQKLKLQIELCSAEKCDVILLFCAVVSRIGTDMEAAMKGVTGNKPVILLFMHHCYDPSHMTNTTMQPSRGNIVQVVHCAFLENKGLLQCRENHQSVSEVRMILQKYQRRNGPSTEETCKSI